MLRRMKSATTEAKVCLADALPTGHPIRYAVGEAFALLTEYRKAAQRYLDDGMSAAVAVSLQAPMCLTLTAGSTKPRVGANSTPQLSSSSPQKIGRLSLEGFD